jgi:Zn finger protein HypA/HybF involved in hydrogenase expression
MGRMKELFIEQQNEMEADNTFYKGVHDSMIHSYARKAIEEYIEEGQTPCPNCNMPTLLRNESNAKCTECAQEFVYVDGGALRFL